MSWQCRQGGQGLPGVAVQALRLHFPLAHLALRRIQVHKEPNAQGEHLLPACMHRILARGHPESFSR